MRLFSLLLIGTVALSVIVTAALITTWALLS
ncbi:MAG: hypothetical protein RIQ56_482 [Candidatus Parcubacteria bacterium]